MFTQPFCPNRGALARADPPPAGDPFFEAPRGPLHHLRSAARAFDVSATDYVVKPVDFDRLAQALGQARRSLAAADAEARLAELRAVVAALREQRSIVPPRHETEVWAQRRGRFERVLADSIDWIEAERDYVHLHAGGNSYLLRETIGGMQERLGPQRFLRIRRSALVQLAKIAGIRKAGYGDVRVLLSCGAELRVGRTYVSRVRELLSGRGPLGHAT